ncbi:MAG: F420H2 dehydrogenase subunit FpoI [Methanosarcinaceae archaeon]|nr:F420H2 dehydrogenase subunit FpoI [Methanosarcinaceae archaeon]MDD4496864.1 F420H2 dehydrogenase subunit FpoI [Methanosarcinaceae archaeon]
MVLKNIKYALNNIRKPPVTRLFPEVESQLSDRFRGLQILDKSRCIGCGICANTCPNNTIRIVKAPIAPGSSKERWFPEIDIGHCLFCGLCIDQCPKEALSSGKEYAKGVVKWKHKDLLMTPAKLAREVNLDEGDER